MLKLSSKTFLAFVPDESDETDGLLKTLDEKVLGKMRTDKMVIFWVSYLDGLQRVLLFTQDERIAKSVRKVSILLIGCLLSFLWLLIVFSLVVCCPSFGC